LQEVIMGVLRESQEMSGQKAPLVWMDEMELMGFPVLSVRPVPKALREIPALPALLAPKGLRESLARWGLEEM